MQNLTPTSVLALIALVPFTAWAVFTKRAQTAVLTVTFVALLFAPEEALFKFPGIPYLGKRNIPYLLLFVFGLFRWGEAYGRARIGRGYDLLLFVSIAAGFATWRTNLDPLVYGEYHVERLPALVINDAVQYGFYDVLAYGMPFILGRALFRERRDLVELLHFMAASALVQGLLILWEGRFSPQLHTTLYGYPAHPDFLQTIRWGGYRPMGFTAHGLALSLFMCVALFSSLILKQLGQPIRWLGAWAPRVLFVLVVACRSTGALVYSILFGPLLAWARARTQVRVAVALALFVSIYPALRAFDAFPTKRLTDTAVALFGEARAQSLAFRFDNEELLLAHGRERLWFGWGAQGRNFTYDPYMGKVMTVADGQWIILLGAHGVVGMFTGLGMLVLPVLRARRRLKAFSRPEDQRLIAGLTLTCAVTIFDLVPNGLFAYYPYLLVGALVGATDEVLRPGSSWNPRKKQGSVAKPSKVQVSVAPPSADAPEAPGPRFITNIE
jgi:hypothetical protein